MWKKYERCHGNECQKYNSGRKKIDLPRMYDKKKSQSECIAGVSDSSVQVRRGNFVKFRQTCERNKKKHQVEDPSGSETNEVDQDRKGDQACYPSF